MHILTKFILTTLAGLALSTVPKNVQIIGGANPIQEAAIVSAPGMAGSVGEKPDIAASVEIPDILKKIAQCESGGKQFNTDNSVLRGKINPHDIGTWQINELYHSETASSLGFSIYTVAGNEAFALWLYENQGTDPWIWSARCWKGENK